jgi:peptide/nickel transport system substrate-binding protein
LKKFSVFLSIAVLAAVMAVVLAACGGGSSSSSSSPSTTSEEEPAGGGAAPAEGEGNEGGTLKGAYTSFPDYMDPQISYTAEGWTAMRPVYVPLLTYKAAPEAEGSEIIPGLAKELPKITNGGKTYTLFLRPGLKYSNGEPIKAGDFKFAVERAFITNSGGSPFYTDIVGAEKFAETKKGGIPGIKTNEKTGEIVINLEKPRGTFNNELALMFVAPVPQSTPMEDQSANPPPASGPYMITKSEPGRGWYYERNPYWAKDNGKEIEIPAGHVDKIEIEINRNQSTQVNDIESGKLNWIFDPPPTDRYQEVKEKFEGSQFKEEPTISTYYFWMNQTQEPFNNLKVREAVNYAVDPAALERVYTGQIKGTQQILPPGMPGYEKFELFPHNVAKAKELVAESGIKDKEVTVWTDSESPNNDAGTYYAGVLNEIGLKAELKILNVDPESGYRVRRLVPGLSAPERFPLPAQRGKHPVDQQPEFWSDQQSGTEQKGRPVGYRTARSQTGKGIRGTRQSVHGRSSVGSVRNPHALPVRLGKHQPGNRDLEPDLRDGTHQSRIQGISRTFS